MNDGRFQLLVDGEIKSTPAGIDNDTAVVDFVRMGALSVKTRANGNLDFDEFESRILP